LSPPPLLLLLLLQVVCVGPRRDILDLAVESGADDAVHLEHPQVSSSTTAAAVTDVDASIMTQLIDRITMSGYNRMDVAIDLVGDPPSFAIAVRSLHRGGTVFELGARHRPPPPSVGTGNFLSPQTVGSPSSSSTAAAAAAAGAATTTTVQLSELVSRSVSLRPVAAGSTPLLRQLVDVLSVQQIGVDAISVEVFQPDQLKSAIDRYERRLAAGPILIKYE
jgi:threonine dehydrogenase-like Zn-dependent dehydrogenase